MSSKCFICLESHPFNMHCFGCAVSYICPDCNQYITYNKDIDLPIYFIRTSPYNFFFRCSQKCLIQSTINHFNSNNTLIEKNFIKYQKKLLKSIYITTTLNRFLYKDLVNIINEYIYIK